MSVLKTLTLSEQTRSTTLASKIDIKREKLVTAIQHQIAAIQAADNGEAYSFLVPRNVTNSETGEVNRQDVPQRVRPWWWVNSSGTCFTIIKYGNRKLELAKGKFSIEVGDQKHLVPVYEKLIDATKTGELDAMIEKVAIFKKRK